MDTLPASKLVRCSGWVRPCSPLILPLQALPSVVGARKGDATRGGGRSSRRSRSDALVVSHALAFFSSRKVCLCASPFGAAACVLLPMVVWTSQAADVSKPLLELATSSLSDGWMRTNHTFHSHR